LHAIIFRLIAQDSNEENYETLWELYQKESLHEQKLRLLLGMSQFNSKKLITLTLERSLGNLIRSQDTPLVLMSIGASSKIGRDLTWAFIKENWEELDRRYGDGGFSIVRIISLTSTFTSTDKYNEVKDFFVKNPAPSAERAIQQSLERISNNAKWLDINHSNIF
jgi:puromycin-sensitive aminopeptidase